MSPAKRKSTTQSPEASTSGTQPAGGADKRPRPFDQAFEDDTEASDSARGEAEAVSEAPPAQKKQKTKTVSVRKRPKLGSLNQFAGWQEAGKEAGQVF